MPGPPMKTWIALSLAVAATLVPGALRAESVTFVFHPPEGRDVASVSLRGTFNGWSETPMERGEDGLWSVTVDLVPGEHQYKYFIDGEWPGDMATWHDGGPADAEADGYVGDGYGGQNAVRLVEGAPAAPRPAVTGPAPPLSDGTARIHYHRPRRDYGGWGLHAWEDARETVTWESALPPTGEDPFGLYWDVRLAEAAATVGFIIHKGDQKDPGPDMFLQLADHGREVWILSGRSEIYTEAPDVSLLARGDLSRSRAHWVDRRTILWQPPPGDVTVHLISSPDARLELTADGVDGARYVVALEPVPAGPPAEVRERFPHLAKMPAFRIPDDVAPDAHAYLRGQLAVAAAGTDGKLFDATGIQIAGVLDDLFSYEGPLGVVWDGDTPTLHAWAPTAISVRVRLHATSGAESPSATHEMTARDGVWSVTGEPSWKGMFYLYEVEVYVPSTGRIETNLVTDPYSRSLAINSRMSHLVDLDDPTLIPDGWGDFAKPPLDAPEDIVLYEVHVRDFSAMDSFVPEELRGTFAAFTLDSPGTRHLRSLAEAGLTHIHLLPAFDFATVNEDRTTWPDPLTFSDPPDSEAPQAYVSATSAEDGYNWGYDPYHYGVPEGSYSTDPDGSRRILEFREMVKALAGMGLRVVMDVVYNHTHASGLVERSVLDKIVPGYYHRLNADGYVETSTCCQNTATEHAMMERLMIDDLVHWARDYKVDGFRFDLMGHHMKRNMVRAREALDALTVERDGVDGRAVYLYGEGWDFGEVAQGARGVNATQVNMAGTGIGTFNDRLRDAVRGGNPFGDRREQGFATGLYYDPAFNGSGPAELSMLLEGTDRIRSGLAGNLAGYRFTDRRGVEIAGGQLSYGAYTRDPQETINYVSAHDNETLFDKIVYAAPPSATLDDVIRMQKLAVSVVVLGQGVPFLHAGVEMLRSKCLDADSYDSGDWFNRLDFTYETNNFGVGLPPAEKNRDRWNVIGPLLRRTDLRAGPAEIGDMVRHVRVLLRIRRSSPLFRLRTAAEIQSRVRFHNTGPDQLPGLIVMSLSDDEKGVANVDPRWERIIVLFNANDETLTFQHYGLIGKEFVLHPVLEQRADGIGAVFDRAAGAFTMPGRSAAVFVETD